MLHLKGLIVFVLAVLLVASQPIHRAHTQESEPVSDPVTGGYNERTIPFARCFEHTTCNSCWIAIEKHFPKIYIDCIKCEEPEEYFEFKTCQKHSSQHCIILINPHTLIDCENCKIWRKIVDDPGAGGILPETCQCAPAGGHTHTWATGVWHQICH